MISITTATKARKTLAFLMAKVWDDFAPVLITRPHNRNVVMMSLEEYERKIHKIKTIANQFSRSSI